jgi:glycosyltransferase involved in cell wall biosynthesis
MRSAKQSGMTTVMEQTSAPRAVELNILAEAAKHYPAWAQTVPAGPYVDAFIAREEEEWQYADLILCGSEFVRDGIARRGGPVNKCQVVPYGVDTRFQINRGPRLPGPLRVLTVGQVRLQKGTPIVWEAAKLLGGQAEFRMVGAVAVPPNVTPQQPANLVLTGVVPRREIVEHYRWADVFLLPSLSEGSATVAYEAMLAGLPVICTPNTGSVVVDGVSGRIVPLFSSEAVAAALQEWIDKPELLNCCREGVIKQTPQLGLDAYRQRLVAQLTTL